MKFKRNKKKSAVGARRSTQPPKQTEKKGRKPLNAITIAMICVCGAVFLFSCYQLLGIYREYRLGAEEYTALSALAIKPRENEEEDPSPYLDIDFRVLREINPDLIGWIDIPGTGISYPIVQGVDNAYYLKNSFEGQSYIGGAIFLDYMCKSDYSNVNTIIYGHHMNDGTMFSALKNFMKQAYLDEHPQVYIYTEHAILVYDIFTAYKTDITDSCYSRTFLDDDAGVAWLRAMYERSKITAALSGDKVITLSTCTLEEKLGRYIVQAVQVETIAR